METDQVKKLLFRQLLGKLTKEESKQLEGWMQESGQNRELVEKLVSEFFLKKAGCDRNRELRGREWKKLEKRIWGKRLQMLRLRWMKVAAVFLLPLAAALAVWMMQRGPDAVVVAGADEQITVGTSKAIVELAGGKRIYLSHDTALSFVSQEVCLENHKDTLNLYSQNGKTAVTTDFHVIRIPRGGEYIARLEDGTIVHLNAGSELKVPVDFGKQTRKVWLRGEAFFDVKHDTNSVFTVYTDKAAISVLGTEFDVRAYEQEQEVVTTLVEGTVEIHSGNITDRLIPGEQARVSENGEITKEKVNVYPFIAWKTGRMVFENERLEKIMDELQRWYDFEVFYAHQEIKELRFTIDIRKYDNILKILNLMEKMNKVIFTQKGRSIVVSRQ